MRLRKLIPNALKPPIAALHVFFVTCWNLTLNYLRAWRGPLRLTPLRPEAARECPVFEDFPPVLTCDYPLKTTTVGGHHPTIDVPDGWHPDPDRPLEAALPYPWDDSYSERQPFQPVKLWRNAIALNRYIADRAQTGEAAQARDIAAQLITRMRDFTVWEGGAAFIESRFTDAQDPVIPPAPWVSAIANAFALMACRQLSGTLDVQADIDGYANAYLLPYQIGTKAPDRWITLRDKRGYLWFDEYPRPNGKTTRVKNGHIFAVLALHEMSLHDARFRPLVQAGATTIEAYALCFRRKNLRSRYALDRWAKADYLPHRAMRQLYQLYELTGASAFLTYGDQFFGDFSPHLPPDLRASVVSSRQTAVTRRQAFEASQAGPAPAPSAHR